MNSPFLVFLPVSPSALRLSSLSYTRESESGAQLIVERTAVAVHSVLYRRQGWQIVPILLESETRCAVT